MIYLVLTLVSLIALVKTVHTEIDQLPYILSFADDPRAPRDKNHAFVRREAANQEGFNHYALRALSRATFVDAHDITVSTDESYEYDPDFYDAIAAQTFNERRRSATVSSTTPRTTTTTTTESPRTTTVPDVPTVTYASRPLRPLFIPQFLPAQPRPAFTTPFRILATTTARSTTVTSSTTPHTTTQTTPSTTTHTTTVPTTTLPPSTFSPVTVSSTTARTVALESVVMPLLLFKSGNNLGVREQMEPPFFRTDVVNLPRRYCRDAIFVLDNSGSTKFNFERLKLLIGNLADLIFEDSTRRVGLITFSSRHRQRVVYDWSLPRAQEAQGDFHRRLRDLNFAGGITELGAALSTLQDRLFDQHLGQGARPVDIVLFTDGYSYDDPTTVATALRLSGHRIFVAALFTSYLRSELDSVTGDPSRVFTEMEGLDTLAHSLHTCF